mmetsp:Transcript_1604/g.6338  ORF Transcript_1604/g.6338 Transcript_1604/m.6338 type:complete len:179 (+) Transcript_1604:446-982(+)
MSWHCCCPLQSHLLGRAYSNLFLLHVRRSQAEIASEDLSAVYPGEYGMSTTSGNACDSPRVRTQFLVCAPTGDSFCNENVRMPDPVLCRMNHSKGTTNPDSAFSSGSPHDHVHAPCNGSAKFQLLWAWCVAKASGLPPAVRGPSAMPTIDSPWSRKLAGAGRQWQWQWQAVDSGIRDV